MIDTVLNMLFRCSHRRLTNPMTPVMKTGKPHGETYVVCLDCGKQFGYDLKLMRMGRPIDPSQEGSVVPPDMPKPRKAKLGYALLAAVPAAIVLGAVLKGKNEKAAPPEDPQPPPAEREETKRREN
jgi:DNA-directed RNA polymerase subunit RPC12/RpoP